MTKTFRTLGLTIYFFVVLTPLGAAQRLLKDPLRRRWRPEAESYWEELTL